MFYFTSVTVCCPIEIRYLCTDPMNALPVNLNLKDLYILRL